MLGWLAIDRHIYLLLQSSEGELGGWCCPAEGQTVGAEVPPRRRRRRVPAVAAAVAGEHAAVPLGRGCGGVAAGLGGVPRVAPAVVWK